MNAPAYVLMFPPVTGDLPSVNDGEGERLLLASIIRRAAFDIVLYRNSPRLIERRMGVGAYNWMFRDQGNHLTAFTTICEILNRDPQWIRQQTLKLRRCDVKKFDRIR